MIFEIRDVNDIKHRNIKEHRNCSCERKFTNRNVKEPLTSNTKEHFNSKCK